ncbi:MAG TPA: lipopolysaccharide kinase InaA family protein [Candidatus Binataceae bacterium]|nr:lipopolysaccharide kinase InaA family protein [Candidatus Binataceae bacterium]
MRSATQESPRCPALAALGFATYRAAGRTLYLRNDLLSEAEEILTLIAEAERIGAGAGNRRSGFRIELRQTPLFVRRSRRGGWMRLLNRDLYLGKRPRPARELALASEAMRRAIPIAEPLGALIEPIIPGIYRGAMITRALSGMTLWEFLQTDDDPRVRTHILELARQAVDTMHRRGLFHADLNLHNLFVTQSGESFAVVILDLDKARFFPAALPINLRRRNLHRLIRSARKLDPHRRLLTAAALAILTGE